MQEYFRYTPVGLEVIIRCEKDTWFILMGGNLDTDATDSLYKFLSSRIFREENKNKYNYVIDLAKVDFVSSTGLGLLLAVSDHKKKFVKLICKAGVKKMIDRHLGGATKAFFELRDSLDAVLNDKDLYGRKTVSPTAARLLEENKAQLIRPTEYRRQELSIIEMAVGKAHVKKEVELMEGYLKEAVFSDQLNIKSHKKYALPHYLFMEKALKGVGIFPGKLSYEDVKFISLELMENSYEHGYGRDGEQLITVDFGTSEKAGEFHIRHTDYGAGFTKKGRSTIRGKGLTTIKSICEEIGGSLSIKHAVPPNEKTEKFIESHYKDITLGKGTTLTLTGGIILE